MRVLCSVCCVCDVILFVLFVALLFWACVFVCDCVCIGEICFPHVLVMMACSCFLFCLFCVFLFLCVCLFFVCCTCSFVFVLVASGLLCVLLF